MLKDHLQIDKDILDKEKHLQAYKRTLELKSEVYESLNDKASELLKQLMVLLRYDYSYFDEFKILANNTDQQIFKDFINEILKIIELQKSLVTFNTKGKTK